MASIDTKQRATDFYLSWLRDNPLSASEDFGEMLEEYRAAFAPDATAVQEKAEALLCVLNERGGTPGIAHERVALRAALDEDTRQACKYCGFTAGDAEREFQAEADARGVLDNVCGILFGDEDTTYDSLDDPPYDLCAKARAGRRLLQMEGEGVTEEDLVRDPADLSTVRGTDR